MKAIAILLLSFFPWLMPWNDTAKTVTDVSYVNPAPITAQQQITARDGHFYDKTGKRVRFLGVNMAWSACFPDKKDAPTIAARLRKLGINLVRMHGMDIGFAPSGIFDPHYKDMRHLDADQLDRLDYFVAQLKQNGIYIDLNLQVSRKLDAADNLKETPGFTSAARGAAAYFYPPFVALQKEYAVNLLTHFNPYTNSKYSDEPAVALVETINERTLVGQGANGTLQSMPNPYRKVLLDGWNNFLKSKYGTTQNLQNAWFGAGSSDALGDNIITNSAFAGDALGWKLEVDKPVIAQANTLPGDIPELAGMFAYQLSVQYISGQAWQLQLHQMALNLTPQTNYTLSFWAKSGAARTVPVNLQNDQSPWQKVAPPHVFHIDKTWKKYTAVYQVGDAPPNHTRLSFVLGDSYAWFQIADVQLRPGGKPSLPEDQSLEQNNITLPLLTQTPMGRDVAEYLSSVETSYVNEMRSYLRNVAGVQAPIIGSQALYGGLSGVRRDAAMDVIDMHGYWNHPELHGGDWGTATVSNRPMVADKNGGIFPLFAAHRIKDKPFVVTEFNEGPPNQFRAEALPMLASFAAWQDWDGLVLFDYNDDRNRWNEQAFGGFFRMQNDPAMLAMLPVAANIFLRGDLKPASYQSTLQIPTMGYSELATRYLDTWTGMKSLWKDQNYGRDELLSSRWYAGFSARNKLGVQSDIPPQEIPNDFLNTVPDMPAKINTILNSELGKNSVAVPPLVVPPPPPPALQWNIKYGGLFTIDTPSSKIIIGKFGHTPSSPLQIPGFQVTLGETPDHFVSAALTSLDNQPIKQSSKVLLTVAGTFTNTDFTWGKGNSVQYWGQAPMLAEGIPATISIATQKSAATVYALDPTGARTSIIPSRIENGQLIFSIDKNTRTIWYEIV